MTANAGQLIPLKDMQKFVGLMYFISRFTPRGFAKCNEAFRALTPIPNLSIPKTRVTKRLLADANQLFRDTQHRGNVAPLIRSPIYWSAGTRAFTADAAGSAENPAAGWGYSALHFTARRPWSDATRKAILAKKLSINPLEMLATAILIAAIGQLDIAHASRRVIIYSDSRITASVANTGRAQSNTMAAALDIFNEACTLAQIYPLLIHIPGIQNGISDAMSRGDERAATKATQSIFGIHKNGIIPDKARDWEIQLTLASNNSRSIATRNARRAEITKVQPSPPRRQ